MTRARGGRAGAGGLWQPCLLTYYQPSQGGINGTVGGGACGIRIDDTTWGCAAPPQYPCGTNIQFEIGGQVYDVPVIDRGGAIVGNHFDLNYAVAVKTGFLQTGKGMAKFRVADKGSIGAAVGSVVGAVTGGAMSTSDAAAQAAGVDATLQDYTDLRDTGRTDPNTGSWLQKFQWYLPIFMDKSQKVFSDGSGGSAAPGSSPDLSSASPQFLGNDIHAEYARLGISRTDQGVDFTNPGPVPAIADGVIVSVGLWNGWPGTGGVVYKTALGNIYVMEHFAPSVRVGQSVKRGQVLGQALAGYPWIETGFANAAGTGPLTPYGGAPDGTPMPSAQRLRKMLGF